MASSQSTPNNKQQQRRVGGTFVVRPVLRERFYNEPSEEGCIEYSLNKREIKSLFSGFGSVDLRMELIAERNLLRAQREIALQKRSSQSYVDVLKKDLKPLPQYSVKPLRVVPLMSRREAREDYNYSQQLFKAQRREARALVVAIANRHPKIVPRKETPRERKARLLIEAQQRKELLKRLRAQRRPQECLEFDPKCYYESSLENYVEKAQIIERCVKPQACSPKQIKKKTVRPFSETEKYLRGMRERKVLEALDPIRVEFLKFRMHTYWKCRKYGKEWVMLDYAAKVDNQSHEPVKGQMDTEGVVESAPVKTEQRSNVAIVEASKWDGVSNIVNRAGLSAESVSIESRMIDTYTNRWLKVWTGDWTTAQGFDTRIVSLELPGIILQKFPDSTLAQVLYMNRFYRMSLEVKVVLNSSMWQVGSLIVDWLYGPKAFDDTHGNVLSAIQRTHGQLNAGSANNVQLDIPYHNVDSFMAYYNNIKRISFGRLSVRVLNPLSATQKVSSKASFSIYVAFKNVEAHGLISRNQGIVPQMEDIGKLCNLGSNVLRTAGNLINRDNPPLPLQPMCFIPQTMPSLCHTDGVPEPINVLRSDPRGQRINPVVTDEMSFKKFMTTWGYVNNFYWGMSHSTGQELYKLPIAPLLSNDDYTVIGSVPGSPEIDTIVYPPVSFLSSFMSKFRGSIEIMLEVICNSTYTGTLQLSMIPHPHNKISQQDAAMSATTIFDIKKTTKIVFTVPWNWYNSWQLTRKGERKSRLTDSIGLFHVSVINSLIAIEGVPSSIYVNVFMRAGPSFEVCQLRTPILALTNSIIKPPSTEYLQPFNFETAWYVTSDSSLHDDNGRKYPTIFIGNIVNGWVGYIGVQPFTVYKLANETNLDRKFRCRMTYKVAKARVYGSVRYGVYHEALSTANAHGLVVFHRMSDAKHFAEYMKTYGYKIGLNKFSDDNPADGIWDGVDGEWSEIEIDGVWTKADNKDGEHPLWTISKSLIEPQMDSETVKISMEQETPSTNFGATIYGENMLDFHSVGRRYQPYGSIQVDACVAPLPSDCPYSFIIPVKPWRTLNPQGSASYDNRVRDGLMALLSNCYGFWDGSIRYELVVTHSVPKNCKVKVSHRMDRQDYLKKMEKGPGKVTSYEDMFDTAYPSYYQDISINPVIRVEVPYMSDRERLSTCESEDVDNANGCLMVWVHSPEPVKVDFEIFYKIGDDFQWSVFQGVPPLMDITNISDEPKSVEEIEPQMSKDLIPFDNEEEIIMENEFQEYLNQEGLNFDTQAQGWDIFGINKASAQINTTVEQLSKPAEEALSNFSSLTKRINKFLDSVKDMPKNLTAQQAKRAESGDMSFLQSWGEALFDYLTHFVYVLLNPSAPVVIWALINLYRTIWGLTLDGFTALYDSFLKFWHYITRSEEQKQVVSGQMESEEVGSLCSVIYTSFATLTRISAKPPVTWANITKGLFEFSTTCRESGYVSRFFKDNVELLRRIWRKFMQSFSRKDKNLELISSYGDERLKKWVLDCHGISAPAIRHDVLTKPHWAEKVFELAIMGRYIVNAVVNSRIASTPYIQLVREMLNKICELESELINRQVFCGERYEPFCLWVAGEAGTCKTTFLQNIANDLALFHESKSINSYHTITVDQRYFDGYVGQPCVLIDDMFTTSTAQDTVGPMYIQMKSCALFNPPFSAVKDKCTLVNFYNLLVSSNFLSSHGRLVHDESAYDRRRDCLLSFVFREKTPEEGSGVWTRVEAQRDPGYETKYHLLHYVDAYLVPDPLKVDNKVLIKRKPGVPYSDVVKEIVMADAKKYHATAAYLFQLRMEQKMKRINQLCASEDSVDTYLKRIHDLYNKDAVGEGFSIKKMLETWKIPKCGESEFGRKRDAVTTIIPSKEDELAASSSKKDEDESDTSEITNDEIEPQGVNNPATWKYADPRELRKVLNEVCNFKNCQSFFENDGEIIEPECRYHEGIPPMRTSPYQKGKCPHFTLRQNITLYKYDRFNQNFKLKRAYGTENMYASISASPCKVVDKNSPHGTAPCEHCSLIGNTDNVRFIIKEIINKFLEENPKLNRDMKTLCSYFPRQWWFHYRAYYLIQAKKEIRPDWFNEIVEVIDEEQEKVMDQLVWIDRVPIYRKPRQKGMISRVWDAFIDFCNKMVAILTALYLFLCFVLIIFVIVDASKERKEREKTEVASQIHPSGDFKIIKNTRSVREKALQLIKPENVQLSDKDIINATKINTFSNDNNGRLNKIVNNVFTLSGIKKIGDKQQAINARCIGIRNYEFIVLKHYIEQFESMKIEDVAIVYQGGFGVQYFKLRDLTFVWTDQGYGLGKFPSLARPFKKITQFIPKEEFDGSYPSEMKMIEVFTESMQIYEVEVKKIRTPIVVPASGSQSSWTIKQGFEYSWGGSGRCGSFLFSPDLACPLVGIHTAGAGSKRGFAELLLQETFVDPEVIAVDMVSPQMPLSETGYMPEGECLLVGHLEPNKSVHVPTKTKIEPSLVAGVFEVKTEPAPMSKFDERLGGLSDPLHEGIKKRCDKPLEFDRGDLHEAFLDMREKFKFLKPLRTPETLSIAQAIEGFELAGYEAMEMSTSEGYPWVLDRPKNCSGKSWMFGFDVVESTNRKRLTKIYKPLYDCLMEKDEMRINSVAPITYFTACLKDARISKEKVSIAGKTRIFEMSPVELTIAQRQYFLDFIAAYQAGRFDFENTIGINPEGKEWSFLANSLSDFSPYILTADYSAYGPRLLHSVQFYTYLLEIDWYMREFEKLGYTELELEKEFNRRYSMLYEVLNNHTVVKDAVICFPTGMPSGNVETVGKNSKSNSLQIRVAYKSLAKRYAPEYADMYWFNKMVLAFFNGDDLIMAVKPEIISWFNNRTLIEFFAEHNIKMTDAQKSGVVREYCSLEEATYLKRGFQKHPFRKGEWMAPLEEDSITDTANWIWRSVDKKGASLVNSEMCARLAYTRGPKFYDRIVSALQEAWYPLGVRFQAPSWTSLDMHVWEGTEGPKFLF